MGSVAGSAMANRSLKAKGRGDCIASQEETRIVMPVEDSSIGFRVEELAKIWERLYRGEHGRASLGIGSRLSLVKAVVNGQGSGVDVSSVPGAGSRFTSM